MAKAVLLRQNILGEVRENVGTVEFEIPYTFTIKKGDSKNAYEEAKKHALQIIADLYNNMPPSTILIADSIGNRHCRVFVDENGDEVTECKYAVVVETYVTDDMIKECYERMK